MEQVELACPYCAGRFPVETAAESRAIRCPNCGRPVTVPGVATGPAPSPRPPGSPLHLVEPTKSVVNRRGEAVPLRRLSPEERARYRRRLNVVFALVGMAILAIALALLLQVRP
jgi:DNA-directed RNA polymerase subunit RPC12/RpoP